MNVQQVFIHEVLNGVVVAIDTINTRHELALLTSKSGGIKSSKVQRSEHNLVKVFGLRAVIVTTESGVVEITHVALMVNKVEVAGHKE